MLKKSTNIFILFLLTFIVGGAFSQSPSLNCVSVQAGGGAVLNFEGNASEPEFLNYEIYYAATSGDPFSLLMTINNAGSITQSIAPGSLDNPLDAGTGCFYMVTNFDDGTNTTVSDTLCSMFLEVGQSNPVGDAELDWNSPFVGDAPADAVEYEILMEYPAGTWNQIATVPVNGPTAYSHEVSVCGDDLNFQIRLQRDNCSMVSNIDGDFFTDTSHPGVPEVVSVDVDSLTGNAVVNWNGTGAGDTDGYIVYFCDNGSNIFLDTVWGINNVQYEYLDSQASLIGSESFLVASFDTCLSGTPPQPNISPTSGDCFTSIFLETQWQACQEYVYLEWDPVNGWANGVDIYEIYASKDGGLWELVGTVDGTQTDYEHVLDFENFTDDVSMRYHVKAYANGQPYDQISNIQTQDLPYDAAPGDFYLSTATVIGEDQAQVDVYLSAVDYPLVLILQRLIDPEDGFESISTQIAINQNNATFNDFDTQTSEQSVSYRVISQNSCEDYLDTTNVGTTIFLSGLANSEQMRNTLTWSDYSVWDGAKTEHVIFRSQDALEMPQQYDQVGPAKYNYEDDVSQLIESEGEFCYYVEAVETMNQYGIAARSRSNLVCVTQEPKIWIPNAFVVNGFNNIFKPTISFADFNNYQLIIYNRWGQEIFRSTNIENGWDGRKGGQILKEGQYMYYMSITDGFGNFYERRGPVMLLVGNRN
jgi:gliding motility-associated-like protein